MQREIKEEHSQQHFTPTAWGMLQWLQGDLACRAHTCMQCCCSPSSRPGATVPWQLADGGIDSSGG